jgi:hypothetical protein
MLVLAPSSDRQLLRHCAARLSSSQRAPASPDCAQEKAKHPASHGASRVQLPPPPSCLPPACVPAALSISAGPCVQAARELGSSICYRHNPSRRHLHLARDSTAVPCLPTLSDCPQAISPRHHPPRDDCSAPSRPILPFCPAVRCCIGTPPTANRQHHCGAQSYLRPPQAPPPLRCRHPAHHGCCLSLPQSPSIVPKASPRALVF